MQSNISTQVQNSDKNTEIKYPKGDKMFVAYGDKYLQEFSMIEKKPVHEFGQILDGIIYSMAKTSYNKS